MSVLASKNVSLLVKGYKTTYTSERNKKLTIVFFTKHEFKYTFSQNTHIQDFTRPLNSM